MALPEPERQREVPLGSSGPSPELGGLGGTAPLWSAALVPPCLIGRQEREGGAAFDASDLVLLFAIRGVGRPGVVLALPLPASS